ncbi:Hypothetical predicted protein [Pelobates cultripes]|uniref:Uncharacterized protein n=1 Tax=Pelobates cultripes TaxID=61616 RepID=A0AAD1VN35_PELCU|nr:Hypothetical predicted protein [Pelobates cultripes]
MVSSFIIKNQTSHRLRATTLSFIPPRADGNICILYAHGCNPAHCALLRRQYSKASHIEERSQRETNYTHITLHSVTTEPSGRQPASSNYCCITQYPASLQTTSRMPASILPN